MTGGGTMLESTGEVKYCEVDLSLEDSSGADDGRRCCKCWMRLGFQRGLCSNGRP